MEGKDDDLKQFEENNRKRTRENKKISEYINAVKDYTPPIGIQSEIDSANSQMKLDI